MIDIGNPHREASRLLAAIPKGNAAMNPTPEPGSPKAHVYTHVDTHVYTHAYTHAYKRV